MRMSKAEKLARAIELRDAAVLLVKREGTWPTTGFKALQARVGSLQVMYRTPFQRLPEPSPYVKYIGAIIGKPVEQLPYAIDVWAPKKVLLVEWDDHGRTELVSYKPGEWEFELLSAARV